MIKIYNRFDGDLIKEFYLDTLSGSDLSGCDLRGCDLRGSLIVIYGLEWPVFTTKNHIRIGCQAHDLKKWESFTDRDINDMARDALDFWKENKEMIINLCRRLSNGI